MPRSIAVASSAWHIIGSTTATFALTSKPAGTQRSEATISWYSSTHSFASSGSTKENDSAPMPFSAASRIVSRREQATHSGGGGRRPPPGAPTRGGGLGERPPPPPEGAAPPPP